MVPGDPVWRLARRLKHPSLSYGMGLMSGSAGGRPTMALDFLSGTLDPRITFTRGSTGTYVNSAGLISTAAIDTPRFDYDPVTFAAKGLLIEEPRTNLLPGSEAFSGAGWNNPANTITAGAGLAPDGTQNALKFTTPVGTGNKFTYRQNGTATTVQTNSVYAKAGTAAWLGLGFDTSIAADGAYFDLVHGVIGTVASGATATMTNCGGGWYRCTVSRTYTSANHFFTALVANADSQAFNWTSAGEYLFLWGGQSEAGAFSTSYIPTGGSPVARSADVTAMTGTNFSSWFNAGAGTFVLEAELPPASGLDLLCLWDGVGNNTLEIYDKSANTLAGYVSSGSVTQADIQSGAVSSGFHKMALAYAVNNFAFAVDGGAPGLDTSGAVPTSLNTLCLGRYKNTTFYSNNHIRKLSYYNTRLPDAQLQGLTS